jgi:dTDP-4-amino-4,6-dideoxygalactose transaminase
MSAASGIPFLDLVGPHEELKEELTTAYRTALSTAGFVGGPVVEAFEREFAAFCGAGHCVGVASGTDALRLMLMAAGLKIGDIVVTVPNTFIATTEAISQAGARPEFVDIDERTCNMDPAKLRDYFEERCHIDDPSGTLTDTNSGRPVKAVIPVHLYGQPADMDSILALAERHRVMVFEDACQAHGAEYFSVRENRWMRAGSIATAAAFSFYPGKNLGACGEAGAVTTNDSQLARKIRILRDHGQARKYYHDVEGYNGRLDAIQAGFLRVKLRQLAAWNEKRREVAQRYQELLSPAAEAIQLPHEPAWSRGVYHLYVVAVRDRDRLQKHLAEANIGTGIHYPIPLHLQKAYSHFGYKSGDFPVSEKSAAEILSLPMYPGLEWEQQKEVARQVLAFLPSRPSRVFAAAAGASADLAEAGD